MSSPEKTQTPSPGPSRRDRRVVKKVPFLMLWRFGSLPPWELVSGSSRGFRKNQLDARSAQFAFFSILALAPFLIVVIASVARMPLDGVLASFLDALNEGLPENVVALLERQILDIQQQSSIGLISIGLFLLTMAGSRIFLTLGAGLDAVWGVDYRRRYLRARALAALMTFGVLLLLLVSMIVLVVGPMVAGFLTRWIDVPWVNVLMSDGVRWGVACGFMLIATSVIYWAIPSVRLPWYWFSPGSVFATLGWVVVTQGFRFYVENFAHYNETYGALGGVVVLMIWLYLTGAVLLMGGQINCVVYEAVEAHDTTSC